MPTVLVPILVCHVLVAAAEESREQQVISVFQTHCVRCHNDKRPQGELSLQSQATLQAGGASGEVVAAGDPDASYLLDLVTPQDGKAAMPKGSPPLSQAEIETLRHWIADGAKWPADVVITTPQWWSFRPVQRPPIPELSADRRMWTRNAIDAFIAAKHVELRFRPAPETDRRTWLRRVTFDLTGLPPTQAELDSFLDDTAHDAAHDTARDDTARDDTALESTALEGTAPRAWEAVVDRLLASPAHGERWARHWLDVVRFSESNGFEDDAPRPHAWPYRDYVIRSLNADTPYDRFVREQLAGDVLEPVTHDGIEATGFLVAGPWDNAAAVAVSETEQLRAREVMMDELVATVSQSLLGLTVNCARCHDHKFDPIPQTDYYGIKAVFEGVDQAEGRIRAASLVLTASERKTFDQQEANLRTRIDAQKTALLRLQQRRESMSDEQNLPPLNRAVALWQFASNDEAKDASIAFDLKGGQSNLAGKWTLRFDVQTDQPIAALNSDQRLVDTGPGTLLKNEVGGAGYAIIPNLAGSELLPQMQTSMTLFARVRFRQAFHGVDDIFRIGSSPSEHRDTAGLEFVANTTAGPATSGPGAPGPGAPGPGATEGPGSDLAHARFVTLGKGQPAEQPLVHPHDVRTNRWYDITGVFESLPHASGGRMALYLFDPNTGRQLGKVATRTVDYDSLDASGVQNLLFFVAPSFRNGPQPGAQMDLAAIWHEALTKSDIAALSATKTPLSPAKSRDTRDRQERDASIAELEAKIQSQTATLLVAERQLRQLRQSVRKAFIGVRRPPPETVLYIRGDVRQPGPKIEPSRLSAIDVPWSLQTSDTSDATDADRRRCFASWVTDDKHPLAARVIANRLWHYHFGRGLVDTPSDFGASGSLPSHPELLDWLAAELVEHDWSLKHIHRLIVTSATYRMRSSVAGLAPDPHGSTVDPASQDIDNRYLWRFPLRRLEAETVRDAMLAVSGELNRHMHGPSVQPFEVTQFNTYFYKLFDRDDPAFNRRTIYRMNVNTGRDPLLDAFDCPAPSVMTPVRRETTTPLQALALMNDAFAMRQAQRFAERIDRLVAAPSANRQAVATNRQQIVVAWSLALGRTPDDHELQISETLVANTDLATLCWTLLNSSEFLYIK